MCWRLASFSFVFFPARVPLFSNLGAVVEAPRVPGNAVSDDAAAAKSISEAVPAGMRGDRTRAAAGGVGSLEAARVASQAAAVEDMMSAGALGAALPALGAAVDEKSVAISSRSAFLRWSSARMAGPLLVGRSLGYC